MSILEKKLNFHLFRILYLSDWKKPKILLSFPLYLFSDCDCDAAVLPSGEVLPKSVTIDGQTFLTNCINTSGHVWTVGYTYL